MQANVLLFGIFHEVMGAESITVTLPPEATVGHLLTWLRLELATRSAEAAALVAFSAVGVNEEFAPTTRALREGDQIALMPPVSGGSPTTQEPGRPLHIALVHTAIAAAELVEAAKNASDGAVVVFDGVVRNNTRGRQTKWLDYEAYEPMALRQMDFLARQAMDRFGVRHVTLVHRLGRLEIGETAVLIVVASAHRAAAFDACRWLIDTLKAQVPIWKHETFSDGAVWGAGEPFPAAIVPEGGHEA
jgi:molybdopterin synthase catalytic subunit